MNYKDLERLHGREIAALISKHNKEVDRLEEARRKREHGHKDVGRPKATRATAKLRRGGCL